MAVLYENCHESHTILN